MNTMPVCSSTSAAWAAWPSRRMELGRGRRPAQGHESAGGRPRTARAGLRRQEPETRPDPARRWRRGRGDLATTIPCGWQPHGRLRRLERRVAPLLEIGLGQGLPPPRLAEYRPRHGPPSGPPWRGDLALRASYRSRASPPGRPDLSSLYQCTRKGGRLSRGVLKRPTFKDCTACSRVVGRGPPFATCL